MLPTVVTLIVGFDDRRNPHMMSRYPSKPKRVAMKAVFFGTPDYANASLRALLDAGFEVPLICTRPARRAGRGRTLTPTPVDNFGNELGISVITPHTLDVETAAVIRETKADVYIVVAYGRFIPGELLKVPRLGVVNIHPSLLPRHRGPSPVATTILNNDEATGVSIMLLDEGMDTGPILAQSEPVSVSSDVRCDALTEHLFEMGAGMLPDVLKDYNAGKLTPRPQNDTDATSTSLITKSDGYIDWSTSADYIVRMSRAYHPWPGTSTSLHCDTFKVIDAENCADTTTVPRLDSGTVFRSDDGSVCVVAGLGSSVKLVTVQAAGRRAISATEFANGRPEFIGAKLGSE